MWLYYTQNLKSHSSHDEGCACARVFGILTCSGYIAGPPLSLTRAAAAADVPVPCHRFSTRPCGNKKELLAFTRPMDLVPVSQWVL